MKAVKTEYQGVVFDSKSEAIFARAMTLASCRWLYHPSPQNGHEWDFIVQPFPLHGVHELRVGDMFYSYIQYTPQPLILVEYKPKRPTDTYIENLAASIVGESIDGMIVYGDPFSGDNYSEIVLGNSRDCTRRVLPEMSCYIKQAMEYRFDLKHEIQPSAIHELSLQQVLGHRARKREMRERLVAAFPQIEGKQNG